MAKIIGMAADHAGYDLKEALKPLLNELGFEVKDFGTHSTESMDYPDVAHPLAEAVEKGEVCCGVAMCGSANGISMSFKKVSSATDLSFAESQLGGLSPYVQ